MRRFGPENYLRRTDVLTPELLNPILASQDAAIDELERFRDVNWQEQVDQLQTNALQRFLDAITPVVDRLRAAADGGFLVATTADNVALVEGEQVNFYVPPEARFAYQPTPFLTILAPDEYEDWALARTLVYNKVTGLLTVEIVFLHGSGAIRSGWTVAASSGVVAAVYQWMIDITTMRDDVTAKAQQVADDAEQVTDDKATILGYQEAAAQSVTDAAAQKNLATQEANRAAAAATTTSARIIGKVRDLLALASRYARKAKQSADAAAASAASVDGPNLAKRRWVLGLLSYKADKRSVYPKSQTYSRSETYARGETYSRTETYSQSEVATLARRRAISSQLLN